MSQPDLESAPKTFNIAFADASHLPIQHVNAMSIRSASDEFFFTVGVVQPPDQTEMAAIREVGYVVAQPLVRFAISRETMEKFLSVMVDQLDQQTRVRNLLQKEEGDGNG